MEWQSMIHSIFEVCIIPLLGILTTYFIQFIRAKKDELLASTSSRMTQEENALLEKYVSLVEATVINCVIATNQTYVDSLKAQGKFTPDAQKEAFNRTLNSVLSILSNDAKAYLTEAFGDLNVYLTALIEAQVNSNKNKV